MILDQCLEHVTSLSKVVFDLSLEDDVFEAVGHDLWSTSGNDEHLRMSLPDTLSRGILDFVCSKREP